jgi:hypothetical protein
MTEENHDEKNIVITLSAIYGGEDRGEVVLNCAIQSLKYGHLMLNLL